MGNWFPMQLTLHPLLFFFTRDGDYDIVYGGLKGFQGNRHVVAYSVRPQQPPLLGMLVGKSYLIWSWMFFLTQCLSCMPHFSLPYGDLTYEQKEATMKKQFRNSGKSFCGRASHVPSPASTSRRSLSRGCATDWRSRAPVISSPIWSTHRSLPLSTRRRLLLLGC